MRAPRLLRGVAAAALLAGCAGVAATVSTDLNKVCQAGAPLITQAAAKAPDTTSAAGVLLTDASAVCTASGAVAQATDPTGQPVDPAWLEDVLKGLQLAAEIAPIVLPAL